MLVCSEHAGQDDQHLEWTHGWMMGSTSLFTLQPEQERFLAEVEEIASKSLVALAGTSDAGKVNRALLEGLGSSGLLERLFPERLAHSSLKDRSSGDGASGKASVSAFDLCLLREGLAAHCSEAETALALQGLGAYPILQSGQDALVKRWIPAVASGKAVSAFALTEPNAGSDPASLELEARAEGTSWRLHGVKTYISNAPKADVYTVFARTGPGEGAKGISAFCVPGDSEGLSGTSIAMISEHPIGKLDFDGVLVKPEQMLGNVGEGFKVAMRTLDLFRPSVGAFAVGMSRAALACALRHADARMAFGQKIREFQAVSHKLADMATRLDAARLMVYRAAAALDAGTLRNTKNAAMAKLFATETAQFIVDEAIQILGAKALEKGQLLEHLYREVRAPRIYEGTSEIQRNIIVRELYR